VLITITGTSASLFMTSTLAFGLSRKHLPFRGFVTFLVFFTLLFNGGLVPTYWMYTQIFHIKNTLLALIVPGLLMNGFQVLLVKSFFVTSIPDDIIDAAKIDGASEFGIYRNVALPLSTPILATIGLFTAIAYWNDWFNGLIYVTDPRFFSLQNLLNRILTNIQFLQTSDLATRVGADINIPLSSVRMAMAVIAVVPILAAYPFFQKYFVKGITLGGVKG
jgi:putative aldouronate transport system permease protein